MASSEEILRKYSNVIESEMSSSAKTSEDYEQFKRDMILKLTKYEKWAKSLGNFIKLKIAEKDRIKIQNYLNIAHLDVTPSQALALALLSMLSVFFLTIMIALGIYLITEKFQLMFVFLGLLASGFIFYYAYTMPQRIANSWRLKASSQMVPAILYVVVYMKHTSNLERAVEFASQHLEGPLALDFKKVFYDVEIGKFSTIKASLDNYLNNWKDYSPEFIESFHLIESSLYEPSESRRVFILEKSLQVILDGVYEKMLKYSREIRSPLTNIYMLGIILPTLGLAILPLASTLLADIISWPHIMILFNIIIPFLVFYMTSEVLLKRPGGYGETSVLELNPDYSKYTSKKPWITAFLITFPLLIIGLLPFIMQIPFIYQSLGIPSDPTFEQLGLPFFQTSKIFEFISVDKSVVGPFGFFAVLLSLLIPLSIALFFSISYSLKTKELIKSREKTKQLESEFTNSLFILGNRLGEGIPAEIAFAKVSESTQGQMTQNFFSIANQNMQQLGMSLEKAIFDRKRGALIFYPSSLISTSMKILIESVKKGLQVAARSLMSISDYVKNIDKINLRLRDLLAEVVSDMKSNMTFLAPLLSGVVVGLATMITTILSKLQTFQEITGSNEISGIGNINQINDFFQLDKMIPPYFIQLTIGIYLIEIVFILTITLVTVDSGKDTLKEKYDLSRYLRSSMLLYIATSLVSILALTTLASVVLSGLV